MDVDTNGSQVTEEKPADEPPAKKSKIAEEALKKIEEQKKKAAATAAKAGTSHSTAGTRNSKHKREPWPNSPTARAKLAVGKKGQTTLSQNGRGETCMR